MNRPRSAELFARAKRVLPGGVSSPVRAFRAVGGCPVFFASGQGAYVTDVDGRDYLDFVGSWGPLILGHAHPEVVEVVQRTAADGMTFGAPHRNELELAERITTICPGAEVVRFTSSGTEATMSAIRLARGVTGRNRIVKFAGCYHGHSDGLLVEAGSGAATFGQPSSLGVPADIAALTTVLPLDDEAAFRDLMARNGEQIAAVILEPMPANHGLLLQRRAWLTALREETRRCGALLIFDEVISGFRIALGGAAELYEIEPDLSTFGKIIGGGMPVGAFAGPAAHFAQLAPDGGIYHAGTLSGNPVAMAAGAATLEVLERDRVHEQLELLGARLEAGMQELVQRFPIGFERQGSVFWIRFGSGPAPRRADQVGDGDGAHGRFFHACLEQGVYLAPSAYEVGFLSQAHREQDVDEALAVFANALARVF
ncbi:MAG: glutamate-1-semialdehyde 2,1-aminomutase [Planctomycetes bacterium]|nr:glutamate-1-semialdehyde 2,1-aminomutase [Planctomycetota bacterium]